MTARLAGAFPPAARDAILGRSDGRCVGCGATRPITCQHRRARGIGGRNRDGATLVEHPANGVALCGSGTTGCHGWAEHHPQLAEALGWRLLEGAHPGAVPYWDRLLGWRLVDVEGLHAYVDEDDDAHLLPSTTDKRAEARRALADTVRARAC